jgi:short-subunit dehydrogenase
MKIRRGDVAMITGASRGIGREIALALAGRSVNLVLAARSATGLDNVAAEVRASTGGDVTTLTVDLNVRDESSSLIERAEAAAGPIDILVNNAGVGITRKFDERTVDEIATFTEVNLLAPMLLARAVLPGMIERRRGHIVNLASVAGLLPSAYQEPYSATKFGVVGFTRSLRLTAQDLGWGVGISAVCPGFILGAGMHQDMRDEFGINAPAITRPLPVVRVTEAVIRAIDRDLPEIIVMGGSPRVVVAGATASPRLFERIAHRVDLAAPFRTIAQHRSGPEAAPPQ